MNRCFVAFLALLSSLLLAGCVSQDQYKRALTDNDNLRMQRDAQQEYLRRLEQENADLRQRLEELAKTVPEAEWVKAQRERIEKILAGMSGGTLPAGVEIERSAEGIVFSVQGEILFASGQAQVTTEGERLLRSLVQSLTAEGKSLRVEGHTDNEPITRSPWRTNLRLSVERALAVGEFLEKSGVPRERIAVSGYGEHQPKHDNGTAEGRQRNRRVAILVLD